MRPSKEKLMNMGPRERSGKLAANQDLTHFVTEPGTLLLRNQCFNAEIAKRAGIENFDHTPLDPISVVGVDGVSHAFHFHTRLLGVMATLDTFEKLVANLLATNSN